MPEKKQLTFNVFVEPQDNVYVAYCLETGLVATSTDERDVFSKIVKLTLRQVEFAMKNNRLRDIYRAAPNDVFEKYLMDRTTILGIMEEHVDIDHDGQGRLLIKQTAYAAAAC